MKITRKHLAQFLWKQEWKPVLYYFGQVEFLIPSEKIASESAHFLFSNIIKQLYILLSHDVFTCCHDYFVFPMKCILVEIMTL